MADITLKANWSDDGNFVTVSKDDWEKIILALEKVSRVHNAFIPRPTSRAADLAAPSNPSDQAETPNR